MSDEQKPVYDYTHSIECRDCDREFFINCNRVDLVEYTRGYASASEAMPYLSREDRELLISGTCPKCYAAANDDDFEGNKDDDADEERFAVVGWSISDVMSLENWPEKWGKAEAVAFFAAYTDCIRDRLTEVGWELLQSCIRQHKFHQQTADIKPEEST